MAKKIKEKHPLRLIRWVNGDCQSPSYGTDLEAAKAAFEKIIEVQKTPLPPYETIREIEI